MTTLRITDNTNNPYWDSATCPRVELHWVSKHDTPKKQSAIPDCWVWEDDCVRKESWFCDVIIQDDDHKLYDYFYQLWLESVRKGERLSYDWVLVELHKLNIKYHFEGNA